MLQTCPSALDPPQTGAHSTSALTYPVALLMAEIGEACGGPADAMGVRIAHALRDRRRDCGASCRPEFRAPRAGCYARHTIASDPAGRFTLLAIVWAPGQFSPPHAHDTWCAYAVAENTLTETLFDYDAAPQQGRSRRVCRCASRAMLVSPRPGLNKSTGLVMPGAFPRSRSMPMASKARASERMSTG